MKQRIDFLVIGAHKSGSTSLYNYLKQHPDVFLPDVEENRFFTKDEFYSEDTTFLDIYYRDLRTEQVVGGKNVHLMYFPWAAERVYNYNPRMKLVVILRNPIDRAYSAYWFARKNGWESCRTFEEAIKREPERLNGSYEEQTELTYLTHSYYYFQ